MFCVSLDQRKLHSLAVDWDEYIWHRNDRAEDISLFTFIIPAKVDSEFWSTTVNRLSMRLIFNRY